MNISSFIESGMFDTDVTYPGKVNSPHRKVLLYELELCISEGGICHINDKKYNYTESAFICAKPGQIRYSTTPYRCLFIHFNPDDPLKSLLDTLPDFVYLKNPAPVKEIFQEMLLSDDNKMQQLKCIILLLSQLIPHASDNLEAFEDKTVQKAVDFINANFDRKITLEDISDHVKLSPIYFHNKFLHVTGQTPHQFILNIRIKHAKKLILTTDFSLFEIAAECGFSSQSYFNFTFKQQVGQTPTQFKKNMAKNYPIG